MDQPAPATHRSLLLGKLQRYDDAQRELEACVRANPAFADAREMLGDLLLARQQAATAAPDAETRQRALEMLRQLEAAPR